MNSKLYAYGALLLFLASCSKQDLPTGETAISDNPAVIQFGADGSEAMAESRAFLTTQGLSNLGGRLYKINWTSDDVVRIYSDDVDVSTGGVKSADYRLVPIEKEEKNDFNQDVVTAAFGGLTPVDKDKILKWNTKSPKKEYTFYSFTPAGLITNLTSSNGTVSFSGAIPPIQPMAKVESTDQADFIQGGKDRMMMYACQKVTTNDQGVLDKKVDLQFKPVSTGFQVRFKNDSGSDLQLAAVILKSTNFDLSGNFTMAVNTETVTQTVNNAGINGSVVMVPTVIDNGAGARTPFTVANQRNVRVNVYTLDMPADLHDSKSLGEMRMLDVALVFYGKGIVMKRFLFSTGDYNTYKDWVVRTSNNSNANNVSVIAGDGTNPGIQSRVMNILQLPTITSTTTIDFSKWMSLLDENTYLNQLSIPGTYMSANNPTDYPASATYPTNLETTIMKAYQNLSLQEQFNRGSRLFHLKVGFETTTDASNAISGNAVQDKLVVFSADNQVIGKFSDYVQTMVGLVKGSAKAPNYRYFNGGIANREFVMIELELLKWYSDNVGTYKEFSTVMNTINKVITSVANAGNKNFLFNKTRAYREPTLTTFKQRAVFFVNYDNPKPAGVVYNDDTRYDNQGNLINSSPYEYIMTFDNVKRVDNGSSPSSINGSDWNFLIKSDAFTTTSGTKYQAKWQVLKRMEDPSHPDWGFVGTLAKKQQLAQDIVGLNTNVESSTDFNSFVFNNLGGFCVVNTNSSNGKDYGSGGNNILEAQSINPVMAKAFYDKAMTGKGVPFGFVYMNFLGTDVVNNSVVAGGKVSNLIMLNNYAFLMKKK